MLLWSTMSLLARDRAANAAALMAVGMIPLAAMAGSGVDVARMYIVKSRLQQACDAGVLAGRKFMATSGNSLDDTATARAKSFFANNFMTGWLGTSAVTFNPVKTSDQQVAGTASVKVPMTLMKMFGAADTTLSVACKARYDIADTDIVFVLDTTGSMACRPEDNDSQCSSYLGTVSQQAYTRPSSDPDATPGYLGSTAYGWTESTSGNGSRIKALRQAVKDFYGIIASSVDSSTRVRYGFVTYSSTVNAGKAIYSVSPYYLMGGNSNETVDYESRKVVADYQTGSSGSVNGKTQGNCPDIYGTKRTPAAALTYNESNGTATVEGGQAWSSGNCVGPITRTVVPQYTYQQYNWDVSKYLGGAAVTDPTKVKGQTSRWEGCIEERSTEAGVTSFGPNSYDLNPDLIPGTDAKTRWRPMWADVVYSRNSDPETTHEDRYNMGGTDGRKSGNYACGKPVHRLSVMTASDVNKFVDAVDFKPLGGTYHDTGMIWGTRLLSSRGIFAADNTGRAGQPMPRKVIVFLTDGQMAPSLSSYSLYGVEAFDKRVSGGNFNSLTAYHNARFLHECGRAREMGIDVWTVAIDDSSTTELTNCARNSAQALFTTSGSGLSSIFQKIAKQVAMLRIDQ